MTRASLTMAVYLSLAGVANGDDKVGEWIYIGTHGAHDSDQTASQGIYAARFNARTGELSTPQLQVQLPRATWLVRHPRLPVIYTAVDTGPNSAADSNIVGFEVDVSSGKLTQLNQVSSGGRDATHLAFDATSNTLLVANHGSGDVTAIAVRPDGRLGIVTSKEKDYGTGPHPRQTLPEPHGVALDPAHRHVLVTDFGADRVFVYRFDGASRKLEPAQVPFATLPPGSGPRHLLFSRDGKFLYVLTELTAEVRTYRWDGRTARLDWIRTLSTYAPNYAGRQKSGGELTLSPNGRFLYVSLRGDQDSIVAYVIADETGELREIQRLAARGKSPWSMAIDPTGRWLFVTNEASDSVSLFNIDPQSGRLSPAAGSLTVPRPIALTFYSGK